MLFAIFYFIFLIIDLTSNITFDPKEFPLLHSLGLTPMHLDRLVQEILKFHGNRTIHFTRGNNRKGNLVAIPSYRQLDRYDVEFSKPGSVIDIIIDIISKDCNSSREETAECLLRVLFSKFEESFASVAIEKSLLQDDEKKEQKIFFYL